MSVSIRPLGIALAVLLLAPTFTAHADESLAETQYWAKEAAAMKEVSDATNATCGTHITFDWINKADLRTKAALPDAMGNRRDPHALCVDLFSAISATCSTSDDAKRRVVQKIKSVGCGWGDPRTLGLSSGKLTLTNNTREYNFAQWAGPQLATLL